MEVEVPNYQDGEPNIREKSVWLDRVDPMVHCVRRIGIDNPEGVKVGTEKWLIRGDVQGQDIVHSFKPGEHRVVGKKRHINVGRDSWLPNWRKASIKTIK